MTLSYLEIYNERINDLLQPSSTDLQLSEDPVRGMVVQGITEYGADSADEILELLHRGNLHRTVEPTAANQVSSRSHAVLQVTVEQAERTAHVTGNLRIGKLSMVDLAGSERASKTENRGDRLKEGANINRSLLALGNCITALAEGRRSHVPFRDSKMTRLLKDSLGGNCRTVMIANISPSHRTYEETVNTLKYANRAKNLKTQVARNVMSVSAHIAEYQRIIMELRNEVADLKAAAAGSAKQVPPHGLREDTRPGASPNGRSQRSDRWSAVDHVDNLEKQHVSQIKDAVVQACSERRGLLGRLTELTQQLMQAQAADQAAEAGGEAAADVASSGITQVHDAIIGVRKQLMTNQQNVQDIVETAVERISSSERLQLLQLFVRGQFMEALNEQFHHEISFRRQLQQKAMSEGCLSPELMSIAMSTESWLAEHRPPMDFHAKMAKVEIGGAQGMIIPSIAQLLNQNLITPQQAVSAQNIGALVRPFSTMQGPRQPPPLPKIPIAARGERTPRGDAAPASLRSKPARKISSAGSASSSIIPAIQLSGVEGASRSGPASSREAFAESPSNGTGQRSNGSSSPGPGRTGQSGDSDHDTPRHAALHGLKQRRRRQSSDGQSINGHDVPRVRDMGPDAGYDQEPPRASRSSEISSRSDVGLRRASSGATAGTGAPRPRKPSLGPDGRKLQGSNSRSRLSSFSDDRFAGQPRRIQAINGAYGVGRPTPNRAVAPARPAPGQRPVNRARSDQAGGVVRIVGHEGLRRRDVPPAAPSQYRAQRLSQGQTPARGPPRPREAYGPPRRDRDGPRAVGRNRQPSNPALRAAR